MSKPKIKRCRRCRTAKVPTRPESPPSSRVMRARGDVGATVLQLDQVLARAGLGDDLAPFGSGLVVLTHCRRAYEAVGVAATPE